MSSRLAMLSLALAVGQVWAAPAVKVALGDRSFTITTTRIEATIRDGMVVGVTDLRSGEIHADPGLGETNLPVGLGHLTGDVKAMARLHSPWGNQQMDQDLPPGEAFPTMHRPGPRSQYKAVKLPNGVRATWTGLTNGATEFPEETLTLETTVDSASGQLLLSALAASPDGGVYGLQTPIVNIHADHALYVASFGGVRYDNTGRPGLITLGGAPFWEAPVVAIEGRTSSLGLWVEDDRFPTTYYFMNWTGKSFSAAIESINPMPFEDLRSAKSVTWHLDSFAGGWVDAMTPYKRWYAKAFAPEMKQRAAVKWADKIRVISDFCDFSDETLRLLAATFDPETVLIHEWNARAPEFDTELPDWTPRPGYVDRVKRAQAYGFKTMAYVNTYCVNYNSPVFKRDNIASFGLARKIGGMYYYNEPRGSFDNAEEGQVLYLDPLSPGWRKYHTDMMLRWREETGTDANYEDVGGVAGDFGNGTIAGKFGAQGGTEQFRELLRRNPDVPMASEYAPDNMAFAVRWPLRLQQAWGNEATRVWWMEHQRPVSAYIHGPLARPWVPVDYAEADFPRHVVVACSDALGGMGQVFGNDGELRATTGMPFHMRLRAKLFAERQLQPVFPKGRWDEDAACLYRDRDGRQYRYTANATLQQMAGPDGQPIYQRIAGANRLKTPLTLPGWPAAAAGHIMGLNPAVRYALSRGAHDRTRVQATELPEGVKVTRFDSTPRRTLLVLAPVDDNAPASGTIAIRQNVQFLPVLLNDQPAQVPTWDEQAGSGEQRYETSFPAHFVFVSSTPASPAVDEYFGDGKEKARYIAVATGLERGGEAVIEHHAGFELPGEPGVVPMFLLDWGSECEATVDYLVMVPSDTASLRVYVRNSQTRWGNGGIPRLYLNGRMVREVGLGPKPNPNRKEGDDPTARSLWDTDYRCWTVPVGHLAGQPLAVTLATDAKNDNNADMIWWSRPKFVTDPAQQPRSVRFAENGTEVGEE